MLKDHVLERLGFIRVFDWRELNHGAIAAPGKVSIFIKHVGDAPRHAGAEVSSGLAEHNHAAASHVFASVIADPFDDGSQTAVSDAEAFTCDAIDVGFAAGGAVEGNIADDHIVFCLEGRSSWRMNDDFAA